MWQAPNQRLRAIANQRKRDRQRMSKKFLHVKRVLAELKIMGALNSPPVVAQARVLLNDFTPKGLGFFSTHALTPGSEISFTIEAPKRFYIRAKVLWCQEHDGKAHVISETPFAYRAGIQFLFENEDEEKRVRKYCEDLMAEEITTLPKAG